MWLRNYYNWLTAYYGTQTTDSSSTAPTEYDSLIKCHAPNGTWFVPRTAIVTGSYTDNSKQGTDMVRCNTVFTSVMPSSTTSGDYDIGAMNIAIGYVAGATSETATYEDYNMQNYLSGFTLSASNVTDRAYDGTTHSYKYKRSFTLTNNTVNSITLNELGLFRTVPQQGSARNVAYCLMYHEFFDEAITLEPSESIVISLAVDCPIFNYTPYPTA